MAATATVKWSGRAFNRASAAWTADIKFDVIGAVNAFGYSNDTVAISAVEAQWNIRQNSPHPDDNWLYCESLIAVARGFGVFEVTAHFSSTPAGRFPIQSPDEYGNGPLSEPYEYLWDEGNSSENIEYDYWGNTFRNTNGEVFATLPSKNFGLLFLTVRRNELYFSAAQALNYVNTVNSDVWTFGLSTGETWAIYPGVALCKSIKPMSSITNASPYVRVEYNFEIRPPYASTQDSDGYFDSFKYRVTNMGSRCFYSSTAMGPLMYKGSTPPELAGQDVFLNANGTPLFNDTYSVLNPSTGTEATPVGSPVTLDGSRIVEPATASGIVVLKHTLYGNQSFNDLGL